MPNIRTKTCAALAVLVMLAGCASPKTENAEPAQDSVKTVKVTENAVYFAPEDPTEYIAKTYDALSASLQKGDDEQAAAAATYFLADFFTLRNKEDESDVGGMDLIPSASAESFLEYAKYYYYHALPVLRTQQGTDALPLVSQVELSAPQKTEITYEDQSYPGWTYDVKLSYQGSEEESSDFKTSAKCTIIKMNDAHYVDKSDVTSDQEAGKPAPVFRVVAVTDQ